MRKLDSTPPTPATSVLPVAEGLSDSEDGRMEGGGEMLCGSNDIHIHVDVLTEKPDNTNSDSESTGVFIW